MTIKSKSHVFDIVSFVEYRNVICALVLRDIKSRFLGSAWGYVLSIAWPLSHIAILLIIHSIFGRIQPYGESAAVWYSTGIVPFMAFSYTMRFIVLGLVQNAPLLSFPAVKVKDIIFARAIVEIFSVFLVFSILLVVLEIFGYSFVPQQPLTAFYSLVMSFFLGLSLGILFAVLAKISPGWGIVSVLFSMLLWMTSGIFFVPSNLPNFVVDFMYYNPMLHVVDMFRSAYFDGFSESRIDPRYVMFWCVWSLFVSLTVEWLLRGRLMQ